MPLPAWADHPIRVLLYEGVLELKVSASKPFRVQFPGGYPWGRVSTLVMSKAQGKMMVNGEVVPEGSLVVEGVDRDLIIQAMRRSSRTEDAGSRPLPYATFGPSTLRVITTRSDDFKNTLPNEQKPLVIRGNLSIAVRPHGLLVVNTIDLEDYVLGVVPAEMNATWALEVLKVQAVAARTYVLYRQMLRSHLEYDVVATVQDQVYRGRAGVNSRVQQAVDSTRGLAVTIEGRPILAAFSSTAAGPTEDASNVWSTDVPYLKGVECPFDRQSPYYQWTTAFPLAALEHKLTEAGVAVGTIATMTPYSYSRAGRVRQIRILHSRGELLLKGEDLRRLVGYRVIPSTRFTILSVGKEVKMTGHGSGHAVGLCQWGAKELAELGYSFTTILNYYYPGTVISRLWTLDPPPPSAP